jgi:sortase (surface protein transpeptidase)
MALVLGGCGGPADQPAGPGAPPSAPGPAPTPPAGVVDSQEHPVPGSATLPRRGTLQRRGGLSRARSPEVGFAGARPTGVGPAGASAVGSFDAPGVPPVAPGFEVGELPEQVTAPEVTAPGSASAPVRLEVPAIGVATRLVRLGLDPDGAMEVPGDFASAGWFAGGPVPGQVGPAVIAGHVDSRTGPAVFYRLRSLRPGQAILVERADGVRLRFVVEQARSYPKAGFPTAAVFGPVPSAGLRLITCTGAFDRARGSYRDNLVVFARLAGAAG